MKLALLCEGMICEAGYSRVKHFGYLNAQNDPRPQVLVLGKWRHPTTRNLLVGGINLNYLSDREIKDLQRVLQQIIGPDRSLKNRYWRGRQLAPGPFTVAYRTYRDDQISAVTQDTLKFYQKGDDEEEGEEDIEAAPDEVEAGAAGGEEDVEEKPEEVLEP